MSGATETTTHPRALWEEALAAAKLRGVDFTTLSGEELKALYTSEDADIELLPQNLGEAIDAFEADPLARAVFGDAMFDSFVSFKRQEWTEYHTHVSDWELQRYLKFF